LFAKGSDDGRNRQAKSNKGACNTASWPPNINPTDEANAPLINFGGSAKCSYDGHIANRNPSDANIFYLPAINRHPNG
jgi:hypothetical protein